MQFAIDVLDGRQMKPSAHIRVARLYEAEVYQLDVINCSIADPAGITVSTVKFGGNSDQESCGYVQRECVHGDVMKMRWGVTNLTGLEPL